MRWLRPIRSLNLYDWTVAVGALAILASMLPTWEPLRGHRCCYAVVDYQLLMVPAAGMLLGLLLGAAMHGWRDITKLAVAALALSSLVFIFQIYMWDGISTWDCYFSLYRYLGGSKTLIIAVITALALNELLRLRKTRLVKKAFLLLNDCTAPVPSAMIIICLWPSGLGRILALLGAAHAARAGLLSLFHPWK